MLAKSKTPIESDRALHSKIPVSKKKLVNLQSNLKIIKHCFLSSTPVRKTDTKTSKNKLYSPILNTSNHNLVRCSVSPINKPILYEDAETISKHSVLSGVKKIITGPSILSEDEDDIFWNSKNKTPKIIKEDINSNVDIKIKAKVSLKGVAKKNLRCNSKLVKGKSNKIITGPSILSEDEGDIFPNSKNKTSKIIKEDINSNVDKVVFDTKIKANVSLKDVVTKNLRSNTKLSKDFQQIEDQTPTSISSSKGMNLIRNTKNNASNKKNIKTINKTILQNPVNKNGILQNNNRRRSSTINSNKIIQVESEQKRSNKKREVNTVPLKKNNNSSAKNIKMKEKNTENIKQINNVKVVNKKAENLHSGTKRKTSKKYVRSKNISFNKYDLRNPTDDLMEVRRSTRTKYYAKRYWIQNAILIPY